MATRISKRSPIGRRFAAFSMMCMSGLWVKISPRLWDVWAIKAGFDLPFPSDELSQCLLQCDDRHERTRASWDAGAADKENTLQQMWKAGVPKLWELPFIKEILARPRRKPSARRITDEQRGEMEQPS